MSLIKFVEKMYFTFNQIDFLKFTIKNNKFEPDFLRVGYHVLSSEESDSEFKFVKILFEWLFSSVKDNKKIKFKCRLSYKVSFILQSLSDQQEQVEQLLRNSYHIVNESFKLQLDKPSIFSMPIISDEIYYHTSNKLIEYIYIHLPEL